MDIDARVSSLSKLVEDLTATAWPGGLKIKQSKRYQHTRTKKHGIGMVNRLPHSRASGSKPAGAPKEVITPAPHGRKHAGAVSDCTHARGVRGTMLDR